MATRWGVASCGKISHDFVTALGTLPSTEHCVMAVAARKLTDAQQFASKHGIEKAYGSYEELAKDEGIEVVYIASINPTHLPLARLFMEAGKAVLCEKPLAMNVIETHKIIDIARANNVFLMEAVWSRCLPAYEALRNELKLATIGDVKQLIVSFGEVIDADRMHRKDLGGGTTLDLGIYNIQLAQLVFATTDAAGFTVAAAGKGKLPKVSGSGHLGADGVDESTSTTLIYPNGRTATLLTHSRVHLPGQALLIGSSGTLTLPYPFWTPTELVTPSGTKSFPVPTGEKHEYNFTNSGNLAFEASHVRDCLLKGAKESHLLPLQESIALATIMETIRRQVGVTYPQDDPDLYTSMMKF